MKRSRTIVVVGLFLVVAGCGGGSDRPDADGGSDQGEDLPPPPPDEGGDGDGPATPADAVDADVPQVRTPAAPRFTSWTCPAGWQAETVLGKTPAAHEICVPPPLPAACAEGTRPAVGETDCQPVGDPCPAGDWPETLPAGELRFVQAGATDGDGLTQQTPVGTINEALATALGATVVIAKGRYPEEVNIGGTVTLLGTCATGTIIEAPSPSEDFSTVFSTAAAPGLLVKNLQITGDRTGVSAGTVDTVITLEGVLIKSPQISGIFVGGGTFMLDGIHITDPRPTSNFPVNATMSLYGGQVTARRSAFEGGRAIGLYVQDSRLTLEDVVLRGTTAAEGSGYGLFVETGATVEVSRAILEQHPSAGVTVGISDEVTTPPSLTMTDVVIRDTLPPPGGQGASPALTITPSTVTLRRALLERTHGAGLSAFSPRLATVPEVTLEQVVIRDVRPVAELGGWGASALAGTQLTARGLAIIGCHEVGLVVDGTESPPGQLASADLTDLAIVDTAGERFGMGLIAGEGAQVSVERAHLESNRYVSVYAFTVEAEQMTGVSLVDLTIIDSQRSSVGYGDGLSARQATVDVQRALIASSARAGISSFGGAVTIADTTLDCSTFDLNVEEIDGQRGTIVPTALNHCGCGDEPAACRIRSSRLPLPELPTAR